MVDERNNEDCFNKYCLTEDFEFGRESLGILPLDFGRESLGILTSGFRDSLDFSSNKYLEELKSPFTIEKFFESTHFNDDSLNNRRESLGILHPSILETGFGKPNSQPSDFLLTTITEVENESVCDIFNKAFVLLNSQKISSSSLSSVSFNTNSIEEPSKIYSIHCTHEDVFTNSPANFLALKLNKSSRENHLPVCNRIKINSVPNMERKPVSNFIHVNNDLSKPQIGTIPSLLNEGQFIDTSEINDEVGMKITSNTVNKSNSETEIICVSFM